MKSNIDDLAEKIGADHSSGQFDPDKVARRPGNLTDLPRGDIDNGGVARILRDQIANASNVETEHLRSFELLNQEFAVFGDYDTKSFRLKESRRKSNEANLRVANTRNADDKGSPVAKAKSKTNPTLEDVVRTPGNVDVEALYKSLMEKQVTVKLGDVLGSSFELCKRLQTATKTQRVPIKPEIAGSHNVEAIVSSLERTVESKDVVPISFPPEQSLGLPSKDLGDLSDNLTPTEPTEFKPGKPPKRPLINRPPKKPLDRRNHVVAFESDDSEDNYTSDDSGLELKAKRNNTTGDNSKKNTTACSTDGNGKNPGTIMGQPCTMLIDSVDTIKLELPMDPSGKDWILRGFGHQVNLVGLCRDVPIQVGGVPLPHNFFITSDNIGQKDIILANLGYFLLSKDRVRAREGMNLQVWQDGDRQGRSVRVTLPIMSAPRNVFPIQLAKRRTAAVNSIEITSSNQNSIPEFLSSITSTISGGDVDSKKLGPSVSPTEILAYAMASPAVRDALYRGFHTQDVIRERDLEQQFIKTFIRDGYSYHQAVEGSDNVTRFIFGNRKYKPSYQGPPVASYNPDSRPLVFKPLKLGDLLPCRRNPLDGTSLNTRIELRRIACLLC
ncbi:hypothetical protein BS47DRAFT_1356991 [Hydnum rufescens UP504]|uniref:DUF4100 domain-containing protein n=1 Tax=Hydnum rufescens UP504 TaxID=1448309 RepID=A0A9P6E2S1_9AGAM|nr:hypothetical protein BS47DRAFT_1356991 [Hydnum rufescens UP504]